MTIRNRLAAGLIGLAMIAGCQEGPAGIAGDNAQAAALAKEPMKTQPWMFGTVPGLIIYSTHYRIYTTIRDPLYQHLLMRVLEAAYAQAQVLNAGMQVTPPGGFFDCYVFGDRQDWELYTRLRTGENAQRYLQISAGGYCQQGIFAGYSITREITLSVIAHEAWHQYAWFAFKDRIPSWLDEGIATQNEKIEWKDMEPSFNSEGNFRRFTAVQAAVKEHRLWAIKDIVSTHAGKVIVLPAKQVDSYYGQLWALVLFLEHSPEYRPKLIAMLKAAREGKLTQALAGSTVTPMDVAAFTENWNAVAGPRYMTAFIEPDMNVMQKKYEAFVDELSSNWPVKMR